MGFDLQTGDRGPRALWNGKLLASAYDPHREAERWAADVDPAPHSLVFVAGDPWGLVTRALEQRRCKAIALLPGSAARSLTSDLTTWTPEEGDLDPFLEDVLGEWGPDSVVWQVWPAFERCAPEVALDWSRRFRDVYRTVQGSWLTHRRLGPRLWDNALRNFRDWERPGSLVPGDKPVVVAASGPSLDDGLGLIAQHRKHIELWALPSSFETLVRRGLIPDVGVATDGGYYAREHLHRLAGTDVPVLAALSSAPDRELSRRRCQFFAQGLPVERALFQALGGAAPEVPSQGTVAVTALRLALEATQGPVFIAGLDLCFRDLRGHTSPHTVDRRLEALSHRLFPGEGLWAERTLEQATVWEEGVRTSPALLTYAGWFRTRARFRRPVYRIAPSLLRWSSMEEVSWEDAVTAWRPGGTSCRWIETPISRESRRRAVVTGLGNLKDRAQRAPDAPWLWEAARTAVPEAVEAGWKARRRGEPPRVHEAFLAFLEDRMAGL